MISISTIIRLRTAAEGASPINIHLLDKKSNVKTKGNHACLIWRSTFYSGHRIAILSTTNPFIIHTKEWEDNKGTWALQRSSLSIFIYNIHLSSCSMCFNAPLNITVRNDDYLPDSLRCVVEINTISFFSCAADEGLPRKHRKVWMEEKIDTTSRIILDAGILSTMTTC